MPLFPNSPRTDKDIDEIFSYIYADLTSIHPSNEPLRIFLQYFQPLFDLTLGIAYTEEGIIATGYLSQDQKENLKAHLKISRNSWLSCEGCESCKELKDDIPHINKAKSCLIIPIKLVGCFQKNTENRDYCSEKKIGSFNLFSRLQPIVGMGEYVSRHVTACFLQISARESFLSNNQHNCLFDQKTCNGNGLGPLNKVGEKLCNWIEKKI